MPNAFEIVVVLIIARCSGSQEAERRAIVISCNNDREYSTLHTNLRADVTVAHPRLAAITRHSNVWVIIATDPSQIDRVRCLTKRLAFNDTATTERWIQ